jgi:probable HAF family extracellular repeat protein
MRLPIKSVVVTFIAATVASGALAASPALAASNNARASITDLGAPRSMQAGRAASLSDRGEAAVSVLQGDPEDPVSHAAVWQHGTWVDLGVGAAQGVTNSGKVVGYTQSGDDQRAAMWSADGHRSDLGVLPGGVWSQATAANEHGQVVGYADASTTRAFIWDQRSGMRALATQGSGASYAYGINEAGQVVGSDGNKAVMWDQPGRPRLLGNGIAYAINGHELVVGDANGRAFAWSRARGLQLLQTPSDVGTSNAVAVNDDGQMVGSAQIGKESVGLPVFHAIEWQNGKFCDLNKLLPRGSGWELISASAINSNGEILGNGVHNGASRAFLLTAGHDALAACGG